MSTWSRRRRSTSPAPERVKASLLRPSTQQSRTAPVFDGVLRLIANHHDLAIFDSAPEVRALSSAGITRLRRSYDPVRLPPWPPPLRDVEAATLALDGSPPITQTTFPTCRAHYPGGSSGCGCRLLPRSLWPSPNGRRVGIRIVTFEACSGFTRVTARRIAQPPKVTFVTRLQPNQLPSQAARQLPDLSTIIRVESSSTGVSRLRGALPAAEEAVGRMSDRWW